VVSSCSSHSRLRTLLPPILLGIAIAVASVPLAHAGPAGDANCDGLIDSSDPEALVENLFGTPACPDADANSDGSYSAADLPALLRSFAPEPTATPTRARGPIVTFLGLTSAAGDPVQPMTVTEDGLPVYWRPVGVGFKLVVEGVAGASGRTIGRAVEPASGRPDLQIESSHSLGDGSFSRCPGLVPAVDPPDFGPGVAIDQALRAFACGFLVSTARVTACTLDRFGNPNWVALDSQAQFCLQVGALRQFPQGMTLVTALLRDVDGVVGSPQSIFVLVGPTPLPTSTRTTTATRTATASRTRTATRTASFTATQRPTNTRSSTPTPTLTRTPTTIATASPTSVVPSPTATQTPTGISPTDTIPSRTATRSATTAPTSSTTPSPTPSPTDTPTLPDSTRTRTATRSLTPSPTSTRSATPSRSATSGPTPPTPTLTSPGTATRTATVTRSVTPSRTTPPASPTRTPTATSPPSSTPTLTRTTILAPTHTPTRSPTPQPTTTRTLTRTPTRTPTATVPPSGDSGPAVSFFGLSSSDDSLVTPTGMTPEGVPIYTRLLGFGFSLVVEGRPGTSGRPVGGIAFNHDPSDPTVLPNLLVQVNRPLGDGSRSVCDNTPPTIGGIPAIDPPDFSVTQAISDAMNDLGCRFLNGLGNPGGRGATEACTQFSDGSFRFVNSTSTLQFCGQIGRPFRFPPGDTLVSVRLRDDRGNHGPVARLIVRL
jgi:hypothetical protein